MKKKKVLFAACILLAGCNSSPNEESTKGIVTDASMNTVTIVTEKSDTLSFSTMNADKTNLKGLLLGDTVEIYYGGNYKPGIEADSIKTVAKVAEDDYSRFFKNGFRVEAVDGKEPGIYVVFSDDSRRQNCFRQKTKIRKYWSSVRFRQENMYGTSKTMILKTCDLLKVAGLSAKGENLFTNRRKATTTRVLENGKNHISKGRFRQQTVRV